MRSGAHTCAAEGELAALRAREREQRRREAEEARRTFAPPLAPLGFSDGLAAFAAMRSRRATPPPPRR